MTTPPQQQPPQQPRGQMPQQPAYGQTPRPPGGPASTGSSPNSRLLSAAAGLVLTLLLIAFGSGMSGAAYYRMARMDMRPSAMIPIIGFGLGAVLVAFLLAMIIRLSSAGAYVGAAVLFVIGLLALLTPRLAFQFTVTLGRAFGGGDIFVISGMPIILAALLAGAGVAASMIRRQRRTPVSRS